MNAHALAILEFPRLLGVVAGRAHSAPGAAAVRALLPVTDRGAVEAEHRRVEAMRALVASELGWPAETIPDLGTPLQRLRIEGHGWSALELLQGAVLLRTSRRVRDALRDPRRPVVVVAVLRSLLDALVDIRALEEAITRSIADDGTVKDEASPALRRVRRELRQAEGELVRLLEREMARLEPHHQVADLSVTMRNGRWVIPVRREARGYVGGIVHDASGTGATIFVEPPAAVEFGNRVRELEAEEQREEERVLRELTEALRPYAAELRAAWDALVALDALQARARYALESHCAPIEVGAPVEGIRIIDGRHPLLLARGTPVVPFDLTLDPGERTLLVSGPNTGGKTVLLKAVGLMAAMVQAGIPAPVGATSRLPVFDDCFADVGDEQSIEASLSTFSAHVKNLAEILAGATADSLVLVDELGSGTDPAEGAALGGAILEALTRRGTLTLASTHLGQLKLLATEVPGVVNASLQFDAVALAPTYRLLKGVPGRSYGLSIARRLRLPEEVLASAEGRLPKGERDLAVLLADVEAREAQLQEREQLAAREQDKLRARTATVADREAKVREKEREAERQARQGARTYLLEARAQVEAAVAELRAQAAAADEARKATALDEAARRARRAVEEAAAAQSAALQDAERRARQAAERRLERGRPPQGATPPAATGARTPGEAPGAAPPARPRRNAPVGPLAPGDAVLVGTLDGKPGRIVACKGDEARVLVGSLTVTVPLHTLTRTAAPPPPAVKVTLHGALPEELPLREVDLRGLRVDELDDRLYAAVDAAVRADVRELRIIHGKGTGALRARVAELLRKDARVTGLRLGAWNEGGDGVTMAQLA
ncbi:MAG: Smr/MutS family protein [Gemmatimonadetes bacterium]|nr:Smr/MutS family protein [Gemmatimonadota bacterium]